MSKPTREQCMSLAMEVACQVEELYGESGEVPGFTKLVVERRIPFDTPSFQAAYAVLCYTHGHENQYLQLKDWTHGRI